MSRRLSVLPEESEDSPTPSPSPRLKKAAPTAPCHTLLLSTSKQPVVSTASHIIPSSKFGSCSDPESFPTSQALDNIRSSAGLGGECSLSESIRSVEVSSNSTELSSIFSSFEKRANTSVISSLPDKHEIMSSPRTFDRPTELKLISKSSSEFDQVVKKSAEKMFSEKQESSFYSKFEMAREFFDSSGIGGGLFSSVFSSLSRNNEESPDGSSSPLLSPDSITSQVLALKSPVSPFTNSPSPRISTLILESSQTDQHSDKEEESAFTWGSVSLPHCLDSSLCEVSRNDIKSCIDIAHSPNNYSTLTKDSINMSGSVSLQENPIIAARRLEHFRGVFSGVGASTLPVDSGYSDDMSSSSAADALLSSSTQFIIDGDSEPLITIDSGSSDTLNKNIVVSSSSLPSVPLSQCRPLQLSKSYTKLVNQKSEEEISCPDLPGGAIPLHLKNEVRRDSLTLPTAAWALFRRRRSSGATDPSPINSPVYYTPPDTSPWSSPRMSLDLQEALGFENSGSSTSITPFQTPRPSFSLDRSPLAHDGSASLSHSDSSVVARSRSKSNSPFLTPRGGNFGLSNNELSSRNSTTYAKSFDTEERSSAPATPYITPQPSPDADIRWHSQ